MTVSEPARRGRRSEADRLRVRQGDSGARLSADALLHALLRGARGARTGKVRPLVRHLEPRSHHVHPVSGGSAWDAAGSPREGLGVW